MTQSYPESLASDGRVRGEKARKIGLLIGIPGHLYFLSISCVSDVYLEFINNQWLAWRERYTPGNLKFSDVKVIGADESFDYVITKIEAYLSYVRRPSR